MQSVSRTHGIVAGLLLAIILAAGIWASIRTPTGKNPTPSVSESQRDSMVEKHVREFCGGCHLTPRPDAMPREAWLDEIPKAYRRFVTSGRKDLVAPDQQEIRDYFYRLAPREMLIPDPPPSTPSPVEFRAEVLEIPERSKPPAVSYLSIDRSSAGAENLLVCDLANSAVHRISWAGEKRTETFLGQMHRPDHIVACDFDRDGLQDYVVSDLGTIRPSDDHQGMFALLRGSGNSGAWDKIVVQDQLGRLADAEVADIDGDGDNDFVVAEFGFEKVGQILWFETLEIIDGRPKTKMHVLDSRHGSIHVPVTDLDGDGDLDVIALISQEYEMIVAFLNDGHGHFEAHQLFQADGPSFGSSGLELDDLDGDGDLDVLFTNGDSLDNHQLKPYHAVHWLENQGQLQFEHHQLTTLPGAVRAVAGDLDGDGDLDIAAVAFCPTNLRHQSRPADIESLIWLEQTRPGQFERHALERSTRGHMAVTIGDFDGDQDADLAVGEFFPQDRESRQWLRIYWNQSRH